MMIRTLAMATLLAAGAAAAQDVPGAPAALEVPSINSVRPGFVVAGSGDTDVTIYGSNFAGELGAIDVLWNGTVVAGATPSASHPHSRLEATIPAGLLASAGTAELAVRQNTPVVPLDSRAVAMTIVAQPGDLPDCPEGEEAKSKSGAARCGAALGELPVLEMVPRHVWYPFLAVPAGGIVEVRNNDTLAQNGFHVVTDVELTRRVPVVGEDLGEKGRFFDVSVGIGETGWIRVPEDAAPGDAIPFYCSVHGNDMVTPVGGILVQ